MNASSIKNKLYRCVLVRFYDYGTNSSLSLTAKSYSIKQEKFVTEWHSFVLRSLQLLLPRTLCAYSTHQRTWRVFGTSMIKMVCSCFNSHFSSFEMVIISIVHVLKMSLISILRKNMYMPSLLGSVSTATNLHSVSPSLFSGCDLPIDGSSHTALELHLPGF